MRKKQGRDNLLRSVLPATDPPHDDPKEAASQAAENSLGPHRPPPNAKPHAPVRPQGPGRRRAPSAEPSTRGIGAVGGGWAPARRPSGATGTAVPAARVWRGPTKADVGAAASSASMPRLEDEGMGTEAVNRLLKAKLTVLREEMDNLVRDHGLKDSTIAVLEEKVKFFDEEKGKMMKSVQSLQSQLEKLSKSNEELKRQNDAMKAESQSLRKDLEAFRKQNKSVESEGSSKEL
ncbi:hypothetical protein HK405_009476, partial [Cladochytrium tenue]